MGSDGADGADGTSLSILGSLATTGALPGTGTPGDAYMIAGDLHVWDGSARQNTGPLRGPPGLVWLGAWTIGTGYAVGDAVVHPGASWSESWDLMAEAGDLTAQGTLGAGPAVLARRDINTQAGAYTLALTDEGAAIHMTSATAATLTVPAEATVAFPIGTEIEVIALGAGPIFITAAAGVTLNGTTAGTTDIAAQWQGSVVRKYAADARLVIGSIGEVT